MRTLQLPKFSEQKVLFLRSLAVLIGTSASILSMTNVDAVRANSIANSTVQKTIPLGKVEPAVNLKKSVLLKKQNFQQKAATLVTATNLLTLPELNILKSISSINPNYYARLARSNQPDLSGALGRNKKSYISVVFQRAVIYPTIQGLLISNSQQISNSIHALEYAFDRQNSDGSFLLSSTEAKAGDRASAASFFYSELGHSLLLLQNSNLLQNQAQTTDLFIRLGTVKSKANKSLDWLLTQQSLLKSYDGSTANRLFFDANAYYLTGKALNRADAMQVGQNFAQLALNHLSSAGYFIEKKGYDSSYQGVSLLRAIILYVNLADSDTLLRQQLWSAITSGVRWQLTRILPTGEISTEGNTRVYPGGEQFLGTEKVVDYKDTVTALYYYYQLTGDTNAKNAANKVLAYYTQSH